MEDNKINKKKGREIESLRAQLKKLKGKPSKKGDTNSKNFQDKVGLVQKNHTKNKSCAGTNGYKPISGKGSGKKSKWGIKTQACLGKDYSQERTAQLIR